jgi:NADH dehydrogenase FAD-containing subunit
MAKHLVLVGAGHAHLTALANVARFRDRGHRVTVISPSRYHYYSGMGPGMLSGIYQPRELRFHIRKMAEDRGAVFIKDQVTRIDPTKRQLLLAGGGRVDYDVASFNTGSEVPMATDATHHAHVIPVKPIVNLYRARRVLLDEMPERSLNILVAGGGPAGVEIAANVWRLLRDHRSPAQITVIAGRVLLRGFPDRVRHLVRKSFAEKAIRVREGRKVRSVQGKEITLSDGDVCPYDAIFWAVGVRPTSLFRDSGIPVGKNGGLSVNPYLRSVSYPELFGGGDCISLIGHDLAPVGVFAVRQNPVLYHNLMAALEGGEMTTFDTGGSYLLILNMGDGKGILWKSNWIWHGRLAFALKDLIDRRFMRKFQLSGELDEPGDGWE